MMALKALKMALGVLVVLVSLTLTGCFDKQRVKPEVKLVVPPATLLRDCGVHEIDEFIPEGNKFVTAEEQLSPTAEWGVANAGSLGNCNTDKRMLRQWVQDQNTIYGNK